MHEQFKEDKSMGVLVANAATNVGMEVIGYDPYISIDNAWHLSDSVHKAAKMEDLLSKADYITVHVPLMEQTRDYISSPEFGKMKDGVIILNFARGGIIRETSLFEALDSGKVAKYITDFPDARCLMHENVICIPHLGASTPESEENCAVMAANEIKHFLERGSIKNSVNMPTCLLGCSSFQDTFLDFRLNCQVEFIYNLSDVNVAEYSVSSLDFTS